MRFFTVWMGVWMGVWMACCGTPASAESDFSGKITSIQERFVPDSRLNIFEVQGKQVVTSSAEAYAELKKLAKEPGADFEPVLWPEENPRVGERSYGLVALSVVSFRCKPGHPSELSTQALMGMPIRVLDAPADLSDGSPWIRVQNQDGYVGYATYGSFVRMTKSEMDAWKKAKKVIWTATYGHVLSKPKANAAEVTDVVAGNVFVDGGKEKNGFRKVILPDGQIGWATPGAWEFFDKWIQQCDWTPEQLVATAKRFLGVPYLWGGTSAKSMDCSGLVTYVMFLNRMSCLRDVSLQMWDGVEVDLSKGLDSIQPGDFLIFGDLEPDGSRSIRHIGIAMENGEFIHAATNVHISSLRPDAKNYDARNTEALMKAYRYHGAPYSDTYRPLKDNPNYR